MARKVRQDIAGYNVAIRSLEVEHTRALENTTRSPDVYQSVLNHIEALLEVLRKERRDLMLKARTDGYRAPAKHAGASKVVPKVAPLKGRARGGAAHDA